MLKKYFKRFNSQYLVYLLILIAILMVVSLVIDYFIHFYNILFSFMYHILINKSVIGWSSGIGSFSATLAALFIAFHRDKPIVKILSFSDVKYKKIIIQIVNKSDRTDFVRLVHIGYLNLNKKRMMNVEAPYRIRHYEKYHVLYGNGLYTINVNFSDINYLIDYINRKNNSDDTLLLEFGDLLLRQYWIVPINKKSLYDIRGVVDLQELTK